MQKEIKGGYFLGRFFSNKEILIHGIILLSISIVYNVYTFYSQLPIDWRDNVSASIEGVELNRWVSMPLEIVGAILIVGVLIPFKKEGGFALNLIKRFFCYMTIFVLVAIISAVITFLFL